MIKTKKQLFIVVGAFILVMLLGTVTYAFFNYTRTGSSNTIRVGRISFISENEQTITLNNLFPVDTSNTTDMNDPTKVGTYSIDIKGDTDYVDGIEYLVSATNANIYTTEGQIVPITLDFTVTDLGDPSANYFTARESKDTLIYKKLVGDTLEEDGMLLVGYIPKNTTSESIDGVDGNITIKAYIDKNKVKISDTYDGTESDPMGTTNEWAEGKTIITTDEWNALKTSGISFKIKVVANEGIWIDNPNTLYNYIKKIAVMDNISSSYVNASTGIDFGAISSDINGKGVYERAITHNDNYPIYYYRGSVDNNNVGFANKCWKIVRTTETGGVKLIYNGENNGTNGKYICDNSGYSTQINVNNISNFAYNSDYNSLAYVGYMYGDVYAYNYGNPVNGAYFGENFEYGDFDNNGVSEYRLLDGTTSGTLDAYHHYTCNLTESNGTCETLRYYHHKDSYVQRYIVLTGGDGIEEVIEKMQTNTNNSIVRDKIDAWYASNLSSYTNKLEDTIWCNDRSVGDNNNNGFIANGGNLSTNLKFGPKERSYYASETSTVKNKPSLVCPNIDDRFTVDNANGNKKLLYPVAMLTVDEIVLAGGVYGWTNESFYLNNAAYYWTMSPSYYDSASGYVFYVMSGRVDDSFTLNSTMGLRPAISLKPKTLLADGSGTVLDPYVIE